MLAFETIMRSTRARIHLSHLSHNVQRLQARLKPGTEVLAAVKADAYGHGAGPTALHLATVGVTWFGIATVEEGREIRSVLPDASILLLGLAAETELGDLAAAGLQAVVADPAYAEALNRAAGEAGRRVPVHLKVNLGMNRLGCDPGQAPDLARHLRRLPHLELTGICGHLNCADNGQAEPTRSQTAVFLDLRRKLGGDLRAHLANSAGLLRHPDTHLDLVRPGIALYGYAPEDGWPEQAELKPVMELESALTYVHPVKTGTPVSYGATWTAPTDTVLGTLGLGYADGVPRLLSGRFNALWRPEGPGITPQLAPQVGRVCMDQLVLDLGPNSPARPGDRVCLFGGSGAPNAWDWARSLGTIPYEILCGISRRVPRVYEP